MPYTFFAQTAPPAFSAMLSLKVEELTLTTVELYDSIAPPLFAELPENVDDSTIKFLALSKSNAPPYSLAAQFMNLHPDIVALNIGSSE